MRELQLTQNKVALVDDADYERCVQYKWYAELFSNGTWYAVRKVRTGVVQQLGVFILDLTDPLLVSDHVDGNGLNNQRSNLRIATKSQNRMNARKTHTPTSSKYKGVCKHKRTGKWQAHIKINGTLKYLGLHISEAVAALAYNNEAIALFGEFAHLNTIEQVQP